MYVEPTARSDPEVYLCLRKFSRRLPKCPRTGHPVSYADMGDPDGVPLLWIMPSGCSRWLVAPQGGYILPRVQLPPGRCMRQ